jgi:hypothetical protein
METSSWECSVKTNEASEVSIDQVFMAQYYVSQKTLLNTIVCPNDFSDMVRAIHRAPEVLSTRSGQAKNSSSVESSS